MSVDKIDGTKTKLISVPEEPTEEMLRAMLAVQWPATYREYLRHPLAGPETIKKQEKDISIVRKQYLAALGCCK